MPNLQCKPELAGIACDNLALRGSVRAACPQAPKRSTEYLWYIHPSQETPIKWPVLAQSWTAHDFASPLSLKGLLG